MTAPAAPPYDVIGVGFGPSNLAMAVAVNEHNAQVPRDAAVTAHFLERQPRFGWHRGMLLDDVGNRDLVKVQGEVLLLTGAVLTIGFLIDVVHRLIDPRLRVRA